MPRILCAFLLILVPGFAASTKYKTVFSNPVANPVDFAKAKWVAFVLIPDEVFRQGREETLAGELRSRGLDCDAGNMVLPSSMEKDRAKAIERLKQRGYGAAILMRLVGDEERVSSSVGVGWYGQPMYPSFSNYWSYSWSTIYAAGYTWKDRVLTLETLIYSIENDELIWAGRSETENPKDIRKFVKDLIDATAKELRKAGLIPKK